MTVMISSSSETARKLHKLAAKGGQTLEAYLQQLAEMAVAASNGADQDRAPEQWEAEFRAWAAGHQVVPHAADDSRESIYEGRGE